jgi:hypothetical protein
MKVPGSAIALQLATFSSTGALTNADSLPTATMVRNGVDDDTPTLTVANVSTGLYKLTGTIPLTYTPNDDVQVRVNATVNSVAGASCIYLGSLSVGIFAAGTVTVSNSPTSLTISIPGTTWSASDLVGRYVRTVPTTGLPPEEAPILAAAAVTSTTFAVTFAAGLFTTAPLVSSAILVG